MAQGDTVTIWGRVGKTPSLVFDGQTIQGALEQCCDHGDLLFVIVQWQKDARKMSDFRCYFNVESFSKRLLAYTV